MDCFHPVFLKARQVFVPCGECLACLHKKKTQWVFRLHQEWLQSVDSFFITLTYDEQHVPVDTLFTPVVDKELGYTYYQREPWRVGSKRDLQLWLKRFRKDLAKNGYKVRYFLVLEYGPNTYRPHYHGILFFNQRVKFLMYEKLLQTWKSGAVSAKRLTSSRIDYCAKYSICVHELPVCLRKGEHRPFILVSKRPGIGSGFLTDSVVRWYRNKPSAFVTCRGVKQSMPKYYRDKIYDDDMKASLREQSEIWRNEKDSKNPFGDTLEGDKYRLDQQKQVEQYLISKLQKRKDL